MVQGWLFLAAYACSGAAGLIYEVVWTRLLTLYMGHSTAAATTVVAAFMGGLAGGSAIGGRVAPRLTPRQSLLAYASLEAAVVVLAVLLPLELRFTVPLLSRAYANGASTLMFPAVRLLICFALLVVPALALGATFPFAVRAFVVSAEHPGGGGGALYAANASGAALGALAAGFLLIPAIGLFGTTLVGVAAGATAIGVAAFLSRESPSRRDDAAGKAPEARSTSDGLQDGQRRARRHQRARAKAESSDSSHQPGLASAVLACTGFAAFMYEIAWTRVFALVIGPSTYAFAATLTAIIAATAAGSAIGSAIAGRVRSAGTALALALAAAALAIAWAGSVAGTLPHVMVSALSQASGDMVIRNALRALEQIAPAALALGVAFPLGLELAGRRDPVLSRRLGTVYAINTLAAVAGTLVSGYIALPITGLHGTLRLAGAVVIGAALIAIGFGRVSMTARAIGLVPTGLATVMLAWSAPWDRELLASGAYKYARYAAQTVDPESALKAGTLLYYRDGAVATVSVKRLAGVTSLSIDGKVDASTSADMLTQKLLAHVPLLLHANPHDVCIIGLGSGVTLASALVHPIASIDVLELSPEVVEGSRYFSAANHDALADPRTHLIVGDGRSHLLLSNRLYDVIISEPSNPWMAGIAALFTREFFASLRARVSPGGIVCQWAHTYDINGADLRSIVATFTSVFPEATMWLVGDGDVLLVASHDPLVSQLANIERHMTRPPVAADLADVGVTGPFALYSLFAGGPGELARYGAGAPLQSDDRMALEFSGPRAVYGSSTTVENARTLRALLAPRNRPPAIARVLDAAGGPEWRDRAAMMLKADAYDAAYQDYVTALSLAPADAGALGGLVRAAAAAHREPDAVRLLTALVSEHAREPAIRVALSKMLAAEGRFDDAVSTAQQACEVAPTSPTAWEQLASVFADLGDANRLDPAVEALERIGPTRAPTAYYAAAAAFLHGRLEAALDHDKQAIARDPQYAAAQNLLGAIYASLGQIEPARQAFDAALRLNAQDSSTYMNLGLLALSSHNPHEAFNWFAEALSLDPQSTAAQKGLTQAREQLSQ
jgi:spermidine synthase